MLRRFAVVSAALLGFGSTIAVASPVTLTGNYLQVGISDFGTFGSDYGTEPGILHDPTGSGNFYPGGVPNDYLTPGTPHDGFAVNSDQTGFLVNDNDGISNFGFTSPTLLTGAAADGYANAVTWSGTAFDVTGAPALTITNSYFFNPGDEQIKVVTQITALEDLTNLAFGRSEDPDPDVYRYGDYETVNTRGDATHAPEDLVSGAGSFTGLTIGIENNSGNTYVHNTGISGDCCSNDDPNNVLLGYGPTYPTTDFGDFGLQMAWEIGALDAGSTATIDYSYVFGTNQSTVGNPTAAPEPMSAALLGFGLMGMGLRRRRKM